MRVNGSAPGMIWHSDCTRRAKYYYYPGFHEPGTGLALGINKKFWEELSAEDRSGISAASNAEYTLSLAEFNANNAKSLQELKDDKAIEIRKFDDSLLQALGKASGEVMAETGTKDPLTRKIYESYIGFWSRANNWADLAEHGYLNARSLKFLYGARA